MFHSIITGRMSTVSHPHSWIGTRYGQGLCIWDHFVLWPEFSLWPKDTFMSCGLALATLVQTGTPPWSPPHQQGTWHMPKCLTGRPRFISLCFIALHRCVFYELKPRPSTSKMITSLVSARLPSLRWSGTKPQHVQGVPAVCVTSEKGHSSVKP